MGQPLGLTDKIDESWPSPDDFKVTAATTQAQIETSVLHDLTPTEAKTIALAAKGLSNKAIGEVLHVTHKTVDRYLNRVYTKYGLTDDDSLNVRVAAVLHWLGYKKPMRWRVTCENCPFVQHGIDSRVEAYSVGHSHILDHHDEEEWAFRVQGLRKEGS